MDGSIGQRLHRLPLFPAEIHTVMGAPIVHGLGKHLLAVAENLHHIVGKRKDEQVGGLILPIGRLGGGRRGGNGGLGPGIRHIGDGLVHRLILGGSGSGAGRLSLRSGRGTVDGQLGQGTGKGGHGNGSHRHQADRQRQIEPLAV